MMLYNPYLALRAGEERMRDALREAEQARLIRAVEGPRRAGGAWLPVAIIFSSLVGFVIGRVSL
jgi:hypothetical protein